MLKLSRCSGGVSMATSGAAPTPSGRKEGPNSLVRMGTSGCRMTVGGSGGWVGTDVFDGALRYLSETGGWLVGDLDFCEYLDRYRNQQVMVIIAPIGPAPGLAYPCVVSAASSTTSVANVRAAN